jgi:tetratricopeptide (TPR) repeat protein
LDGVVRKVTEYPQAAHFRVFGHTSGGNRWALAGGFFAACLWLTAPVLADDAADDAAARYLRNFETADQYWDTIERIEGEHSPYSTELADLYLSLGRTLLDSEQLEEARDALQRGIQVIRVNYGLKATEQVDFLYTIAEIEQRLEGWDAAEKVIRQIHLINQQGFADDNEHLLPALEQVYAWYSVHRPMDSPESRYADMDRFNALAQEMALITEQEKGIEHPDTTAIFRTIGQIHYKIIDYFLGDGTKYEPELVVFTGISAPRQKNKSVSMDNLYDTGTEALQRFIESVEQRADLPAVELAEAFAQVGEWYLINGKTSKANEEFEKAYRTLLEDESTSGLAAAYFANPTPARLLDPDHDLGGYPRAEPEGEFLELSINVNRLGEVTRVDVLDAPEIADKGRLRSLLQELRDERFRPALLDGQPVRTREFIWRYPIDIDELIPEVDA